MGKQAKEWARKWRRWLIKELGDKCAECGEEEYEKLTIDHIYGKDYETTGLSTDQRMCRYLREHKLGLVQCLCLTCNSRRGDPRQIEEREKFRLILKLNGSCDTGCEEVYLGDLTFVHADPDWTCGDLVGDAKVAAYAREMEEGRLRLYCPACIACLTASEPESELEPF